VLTALGLLSTGAGAWTANSTTPPCGGNVSLIASEPSFATLTTASLAGWGCSVHETWPTFPTDWNALAVATDTPTTPTCGVDPKTGSSACGQAYILIAGSSIVVVSGSIAVEPAEATNPAGTNHTVTAHVTSDGEPLAEQTVTFTVTGQNAGAAGTCLPAAVSRMPRRRLVHLPRRQRPWRRHHQGQLHRFAAGAAVGHRPETLIGREEFPASPRLGRDVEVQSVFDPGAQEVRTAYVALQNEGVKILDVTDPDAIETLGSYAPATCANGSSSASFFADDVELVAGLSALFVAAGRCGVLVLDVANPAAPVLRGAYNTPVWAEAIEVDLSASA
jgi:hypothetical protein